MNFVATIKFVMSEPCGVKSPFKKPIFPQTRFYACLFFQEQ
ncbi:Hypothetical protein Minf_1224 [Methylacidiphilum infernorum V4]|uniref:Uncharacterized protein n=1 Tax=Methylacidiphilum infernorum (isolate V4) TaxID=481448 RepID=B3DVC5_METI4|nr:Hypothetical protein Minf_1224 [Methylacidiphilum infernorum V4]